MQIKTDKYKCPCCGGHINPRTMQCEYCDTQFEDENRNLIGRVETFTNPVAVLSCQSYLDKEAIACYGLEKASEYVLREMVTGLVDKIYPFMEVRATQDVTYSGIKLEGRIKCTIPKEHSIRPGMDFTAFAKEVGLQ